MLYDPHHDLYALLGVAADASTEVVARAIARLRATGGGAAATAAEVLLDPGQRARYDARRAQHRVGQLLAFDWARTAAHRRRTEGRPRSGKHS